MATALSGSLRNSDQTTQVGASAGRMTDGQVDDALRLVPEWSLVGDTIQRTFQFVDFVAAIKFVNECALQAETSHHHPDILIRYSRVTLTLATHDAGGITAKDFALASQSDAMASRYDAPPVKAVKSKAKK